MSFEEYMTECGIPVNSEDATTLRKVWDAAQAEQQQDWENLHAMDLPDPEQLPNVAGRTCPCSNAELERRLRFYLAIEQGKLCPDNGVISVLCDAVRCVREYSDYANGNR